MLVFILHMADNPPQTPQRDVQIRFRHQPETKDAIAPVSRIESANRSSGPLWFKNHGRNVGVSPAFTGGALPG